MKKRLAIPARLSVSVVFSVACSGPSPAVDAATDARADALDALGDALADAVGDRPRDTACFEVDRDFLDPDPGFTCAPRPGMAQSVVCPAERVCDPAECPAGCESCREPNICQPDREGVVCPTRYACSLNGCGDGCRAVG